MIHGNNPTFENTNSYCGYFSNQVGSPCCQDQQLRSLSVPESIHEEWKKGGTSRARLQELFASCGFDKDTTWFSSLFCHDFRSHTQKKNAFHSNRQPMQEAFVGQVNLESEHKQSLTMKMKAQWMSEDKMRENFKEQLGLCLYNDQN